MKVHELIDKLMLTDQNSEICFATTYVRKPGTGITLSTDNGPVLVISAPEENRVEIYFRSTNELRW